jgi:hypothetical protein
MGRQNGHAASGSMLINDVFQLMPTGAVEPYARLIKEPKGPLAGNQFCEAQTPSLARRQETTRRIGQLFQIKSAQSPIERAIAGAAQGAGESKILAHAQKVLNAVRMPDIVKTAAMAGEV